MSSPNSNFKRNDNFRNYNNNKNEKNNINKFFGFQKYSTTNNLYLGRFRTMKITNSQSKF